MKCTRTVARSSEELEHQTHYHSRSDAENDAPEHALDRLFGADIGAKLASAEIAAYEISAAGNNKGKNKGGKYF